jgi:GNAT superfamily N-acetyltransferase
VLDTATRRLASLRALLADLVCIVRRRGLGPTLGQLAGDARTRARGFVRSEETDDILVKEMRADAAPEGTGEFRLERVARRHAPELRGLSLESEPCNARRSRYALDCLEAGYAGFLIRQGDTIVGHFWWIDRHHDQGHPDLATYHIELGDGDVYGFGYRLAQQVRGGGVSSQLLLAVEAELARAGYERMWGFVDTANTAARWTYVLGGWTVAHTIKRERRLGVSRDTVLAPAGAGG